MQQEVSNVAKTAIIEKAAIRFRAKSVFLLVKKIPVGPDAIIFMQKHKKSHRKKCDSLCRVDVMYKLHKSTAICKKYLQNKKDLV